MPQDDLPPELLALLRAAGLPEAQTEDNAGSLEDEADDALDSGLADLFWQQARQSREIFAAAGIEEMPDAQVFGDMQTNSGTEEVTEEDYEEGPLREVFLRLRAHARILVGKSSRPSQRFARLRWMMMPIADAAGLMFEDACEALQCRPTVFRVRALYQMFLNGVSVQDKLPPLIKGLPKSFADELLDHPQLQRVRDRVEVARVCWSLPGRPLEEVVQQASERGCTQAADAALALQEYGYIGVTLGGAAYFIARNPALYSFRARHRFSWPAAIVGE